MLTTFFHLFLPFFETSVHDRVISFTAWSWILNEVAVSTYYHTFTHLCAAMIFIIMMRLMNIFFMSSSHIKLFVLLTTHLLRISNEIRYLWIKWNVRRIKSQIWTGHMRNIHECIDWNKILYFFFDPPFFVILCIMKNY